MIDEDYSRPGRRVVTVHGIPLPAPRRAPDDWRLQAACRTADPATFDFDPTTRTATLARARRAKSVCDGCPVIAMCRISATTHERATADASMPISRQTATFAGGLTPWQRHPDAQRLCQAEGCRMPPWAHDAVWCVPHATEARARTAARHTEFFNAARRARREARLAELEVREAVS